MRFPRSVRSGGGAMAMEVCVMMMMTMHLPWPHRPRGGRRWADRDAEASDLHLNEIEIHSANSFRIDR
ncbi:MAG: hypothetical protein ABGY24_04755, partial [bacterium]